MKYYERIVIEWSKISKEKCEGIITLDRWKDERTYLDNCETFMCNCEVTSGSVRFYGVGPKGLVIPLGDEEMEQLKNLLRWYFDGVIRNKETFCWFIVKDKKELKNVLQSKKS